jgi:hypothetical protein
LATDQVTAQNKEKIDTDPAPAMNAAGHRKAHNAGVINDDDDNGDGAKKIETRLTFAIAKARIDSEPEWRCRFNHEALVISYQLIVIRKEGL